MPTKPKTHAQLVREARGGRAPEDQAYRERRLADPALAELERLRHTARWGKVRAHVLRLEPLCRDCRLAGVTRQAQDFDHIDPARVNPEAFFDLGNLQALCRPWHNRKTARERRG